MLYGFYRRNREALCRPSSGQQILCSCHKVNAVKFQSVDIPNGLIDNVFGSGGGKKHDSSLLGLSNLYQDLVQHSHKPDVTSVCVYGDSTYHLRLQIQGPLRNHAVITPMQQEYNKFTR